MPQNPEIIATKTSAAKVLLFDRTKHPSIAPTDGKCRPEMTLLGHSEEGYGLSWNPFVEGHLISGSDDGLICYWNVACPKKDTLHPMRTFSGHSGIVEDVAWHLKNEHFFASASDDQTVRVWDVRQKDPSHVIFGHRSEINSVAFSPQQEFYLLSGSKDKTVGLWDLRNPNVRLHMLEGHEDSVFQVEWSPFDSSVVASCGADSRVIIWDLRRIGKEQSPEDAVDGPPELIFIHGGHTDKVSDFGWCPGVAWTAASVSDNNILQVWTVADAVHKAEPILANLDLE